MSAVAYAEAVRALCLGAGSPDASAPLHVYRRMVRVRFRDVLASSTPRFVKAAGDAALDAWVDHWLETTGPTTRLFWQLPLTAHASAHALAASGVLAPWQLALLTYELALWETRHTAFPESTPAGAFAFDRPPVLTRARKRITLTHRAGDTQADAEETHYVLFRRADDSVGARTLNRVGALVLSAMEQESAVALDARMRALLTDHALAGGQTFAVSLGEMLAAWMEDGLLLGSAR
jgi:hypothetical protein